MRGMAEALKVLAHADRLRILEFLDLTGAAPVFRIVEETGLAQATTSQHLNRMRRGGLIQAERRGKEVWYSIAEPNAVTILNCIRRKHGEHS
jgi:DNA-binding transcriptional ArsR family regulator